MTDTCVPYYFKISHDCCENDYTGFDYQFNDDLTIRCYYHYNLEGEQICYHIFDDGEHVDEVFTTIKETIHYCETFDRDE